MPVLPILMTLLIVLLMFVFGGMVGAAHGKYDVKSPATYGNADFERVFRVQMNTIEQAIMFLPAFWIAAIYSNEMTAVAFAGVWIVGRILYARGYMQDAGKRGVGFAITLIGLTGVVVQGFWAIIAHSFFA